MWRKLTAKDITRGVVVRFPHLSIFNMGIIIAVPYNEKQTTFTIARPIAWTRAAFNSNSPMLDFESVTVEVNSSYASALEVNQFDDDKILTYTV